jgi:hypothetical protein
VEGPTQHEWNLCPSRSCAIQIKIPALSLQRTEGQGRGTRFPNWEGDENLLRVGGSNCPVECVRVGIVGEWSAALRAALFIWGRKSGARASGEFPESTPERREYRGPFGFAQGRLFDCAAASLSRSCCCAQDDRVILVDTEQQVPRRRRRCRSDLLGMTKVILVTFLTQGLTMRWRRV